MNKNAIILPVLAVFLVLFVDGALAITGEQGSFVTETITMEAKEGVLKCYNNNTVFNVYCQATSSTELKVIIGIPEDRAVGYYSIPILLDSVYNETITITVNETLSYTYGAYTVTIGEFIYNIGLNVTEPAEPDEPEQNESDEDLGTIKISLMGLATRGKMATVRTTDEDGKSLIATVSITDPEGNAQIIETNMPTKGFGQFQIAEDSDVPVSLIAFAEGYESGVYLINELKGEKLSEEQEPEPTKTLVIKRIEGEVMVHSTPNGTVVVSETGEVAGDALVSITKPDNSAITTHTDQNGMFKVYLDQTGTWKFVASKDDHTDSSEASFVSRVPREDIETIAMWRGNQRITEALAGETVSFGIYNSTDGIIEDDFSVVMTFMGHDDKVTFTGGWLKGYTMPENDAGSFTVNVDKSENYNEASETFNLVIGFDFSVFLMPLGIAAVIIIIILIVIGLLRRRGGGGGAQYGTPPSMEERVG